MNPSCKPTPARNGEFATKVIDECLDPPDPNALRAYTDSEHVLAMFTAFSHAFPDARVDIDWIAPATDRIAIGGRISATHAGTWRNVTATGRRVVFATTLMLEVDGDRVTDMRTVTDTLAVAEQIGAVPALGPPACRLRVPHGAPDNEFTKYQERPT